MMCITTSWIFQEAMKYFIDINKVRLFDTGILQVQHCLPKIAQSLKSNSTEI